MTHQTAVERLADLEARQRAAERDFLATMARSFDGYIDAMTRVAFPIKPVEVLLNHMRLLDAFDTLCIEYGWEQATPEGVDLVLRRHGSEELANAGAALLPWEWPADGKSLIDCGTALKVAADARWEAGQSAWPEALYRWFDNEHRLLYVGISANLDVRQTAHAKRSSWSQFAAHAVVVWYPDRGCVQWAEVNAIKSERPLFNHAHNDTPEARERLVAYLIEKGRTDLLLPAVSRADRPPADQRVVDLRCAFDLEGDLHG